MCGDVDGMMIAAHMIVNIKVIMIGVVQQPDSNKHKLINVTLI